jgi:hypothetical protein
MTGIFKPMILLPVSLVTQLRTDEVEAILLHELAHIKRKDYFVNLIQHFAEIIFFFNPAVLWLSSVIRDEREHCCDDLAIHETRSKEKFIQALVVFQEYHLRDTQLALGFPGQKNHLLGRVKRIITNKNKSLNNMEKIVLIAGIVLFGLFAVTFSQQKPSAPKSLPEAKVAPPMEIQETTVDISDSVPKKKNLQNDIRQVTTGTTNEGKQCKIVEVNGKMTELYIDGKKVPKEKWSDYEPVRIDIKVRADAEKQKFSAEEDALKYEKEAMELEQKQELMNQDRMKEVLMDKVIREKIDLETERAIMELKAKNELVMAGAHQALNEKQVELAKRIAEMKEIQMAKVEMSKERPKKCKEAIELKAALGQMSNYLPLQ